jgi:hypothetical protein
MHWKQELRKCRCGESFRPKRESQRHCKERCRDLDKKHRKRSGDKNAPLTQGPRSGDTPLTDAPTGSVAHAEGKRGTLGDGPTMIWPERDPHVWPTPGALQGDDYPLEYYEDGYPKLPTCLDRRRKPEPLAEAA